MPGPNHHGGTPCPICGRPLPLPAGLPGGTVLTHLLFLKVLGQTVNSAWATARDVLDDEGLRSSLLTPIERNMPDAYISLNQAHVPDPISPAVRHVAEQERAEGKVGVRRLIYAMEKRRALLTVILRETYGAGFQRDEARVAARLGFDIGTVRLAIRDKKLIRV